MFNDRSERPHPPLLTSTIKAVVAIGVLSVLASGWLSQGTLDHGTLGRLAADASRRGWEPTTTGSIIRSANNVRLDPCAADQRTR
jgi:hypothetical protein